MNHIKGLEHQLNMDKQMEHVWSFNLSGSPHNSNVTRNNPLYVPGYNQINVFDMNEEPKGVPYRFQGNWKTSKPYLGAIVMSFVSTKIYRLKVTGETNHQNSACDCILMMRNKDHTRIKFTVIAKIC